MLLPTSLSLRGPFLDALNAESLCGFVKFLVKNRPFYYDSNLFGPLRFTTAREHFAIRCRSTRFLKKKNRRTIFLRTTGPRNYRTNAPSDRSTHNSRVFWNHSSKLQSFSIVVYFLLYQIHLNHIIHNSRFINLEGKII